MPFASGESGSQPLQIVHADRTAKLPSHDESHASHAQRMPYIQLPITHIAIGDDNASHVAWVSFERCFYASVVESVDTCLDHDGSLQPNRLAHPVHLVRRSRRGVVACVWRDVGMVDRRHMAM